MTGIRVAVILGAIACLAAGPLAGSDKEGFNRRAAERDVATFRALDVDGDGRLTREEVGGTIDMLARFDDFDIDRDGIISTAELERYVRQRYGVEPPSLPAQAVAPSPR